MPAPAPAAVVSDTTAQEQSLSEAASAVDSKVDDRGGTPTTEAEPAVSGALKMIEGSKIPLLVFVNSRSGGQQGKPLLAQFSSWLRPEQVSPSGSSLRSGSGSGVSLVWVQARSRAWTCTGTQAG